SAHDAATAADQRAHAAKVARLYNSQLAAAKGHLRARDAAAQRMSVHIENAVADYRTMLEESTAARRACPVGALWPDASKTGAPELVRLVAHEVLRLGSPWPRLPDQLPDFPCGISSHLVNPGKIEPLAEILRS